VIGRHNQTAGAAFQAWARFNIGGSTIERHRKRMRQRVFADSMGPGDEIGMTHPTVPDTFAKLVYSPVVAEHRPVVKFCHHMMLINSIFIIKRT
jgi:hypothetical protein